MFMPELGDLCRWYPMSVGGHSLNWPGFDPRPIQVLFVVDKVRIRHVLLRVIPVSADPGGTAV